MIKMIKKNLFLFSIALLPFLHLNGQSNPTGVHLEGVGFNLGWFNPSLDYWENESEFKDADFNGAFQVKAFADIFLFNTLSLNAGIGLWQSTVDEDLQGFGMTTWTLSGYPLSLDLIYKPDFLKINKIQPYLGIGGEFLLIQQKLQFEKVKNPDPSNGSSAMLAGIVGVETQLSAHFTLAIDFDYKFGNYNQEFKVYEENPEDPENPVLKEIVTEEISLSGPKVGLTLKYLF